MHRVLRDLCQLILPEMKSTTGDANIKLEIYRMCSFAVKLFFFNSP